MGWLSNKVGQWAGGRQQEEMQTFIAMLRTMDSTEIGLVVAGATHMRHGLESSGHNVMDPIVYTSQNPTFAIFLSRTIAECQKQGRTHDAAGLMVWLHTMRAGIRIELRGLAREMWGQLSRGFPHVETSSIGIRGLSGGALNIQGATEYPAGFTPTPL